MNVWATCLCFWRHLKIERNPQRAGPARAGSASADFQTTHEQTQRFVKHKSMNRQARWTHIQHEHNRRHRSIKQERWVYELCCEIQIFYFIYLFIYFFYGCARGHFLCSMLRVLSFCFIFDFIYSMCVAVVTLQTNSLRQEGPNFVFCPCIVEMQNTRRIPTPVNPPTSCPQWHSVLCAQVMKNNNEGPYVLFHKIKRH